MHYIHSEIITEDEMLEASTDSFSLKYEKLNRLLQKAVLK